MRELIFLADNALDLSQSSDTSPGAVPKSVASMATRDALRHTLDQYEATVQETIPRPPRAIGAVSPPGLGTKPSNDPLTPSNLVFRRISADDSRLDELARELRAIDGVRASYVKPAVSPAINVMSASGPPPSGERTPDFTPRQGYLDPAPGGVDARFAWTHPGGMGTDVTIIDVEGAWRQTHEDLQNNNKGLLYGTSSPELDWRNHGSAVLGVLNSPANGKGTTGIACDATVGMVSVFLSGKRSGTANAIRQAADRLAAGDIMLLEMHRPGPRHDFNDRADQSGYIAVEWWPDDFQQVQYAVNKGIIVVQAAGNGGENLDDPLYATPDFGFGPDWTNPFARIRDSGAILVGAGAPPNRGNGHDHGPDRSRLDFSNYGSALDVQGWGREVATCGYGDLQGGPDEDVWYTDQFSGTSSASPMIVGVLACLQGYLKAANRPLLTPRSARDILRASGSVQVDAPGRPTQQRIGSRPDLRELLAILAEVSSPTA